jgi:hypothetical protein
MEQNINKDYSENLENIILKNKLNQFLVPDLNTFSSWADFKIKILNKEYILDFLFNTNNLKTFSPSFFKFNDRLLFIKYSLLLGLIIGIIFTKNYISLFLILISTIGSSFMQGRKDRLLLKLLLTIISILLFQYFFMVNWIFILTIILSSCLNFWIYQNYDHGLTNYIMKHPDNIISLLENKVILKLIDKKNKREHVYFTIARKEQVNNLVNRR